MADVEHPGIRCTAEGSLTAALASDAVLDAAFGWLCKRRRAWPADADLWSSRHDWPDEKAAHQRGAARRPVPLPTTAARDQGGRQRGRFVLGPRCARAERTGARAGAGLASLAALRRHLLKLSLPSLFSGLIRMPRRTSASRRSISISALTLRKSATAHRFTASRMAFSARSGKAMRSGPGGRPG